ncbi:MAG TPA: chloride channel protein [Actinophytocola sp.]|uniref:chloride channel protein n=1 Tax=Actinophytocola sp. TaxID=1872138 RepID=UPI002E090811|nr:chloride channel protein [Actinophytocola sp.]
MALGKILATSLTIGIGGSGGVSARSLFIGAMLGAAFGTLTHHLLPHLTGPPGAYALVGMGAVFAGAARTPITAVMILFELTGEYTIILPLMVAIALSAGLSRLISPDTIYTRKLRRRGIHLDRPARARTLDRLTVATAMRPLPEPLHPATTLPELATRFATTTDAALPVIDDNGELRGTVLAAETDTATAADPARTLPALHPDQSLEDTLAEPIRHGPGPAHVGHARHGHRLRHQRRGRHAPPTGRPGDEPVGQRPVPRSPRLPRRHSVRGRRRAGHPGNLSDQIGQNPNPPRLQNRQDNAATR